MPNLIHTALAQEKGYLAAIIPDGCRGDGLSIIENCQGPQLLELFANIIQFMIDIAFVIAVVMVLWGGILLMVSGGNEDRVKRGRKALTGAIVGLVIVLVAWIVINTIITFFTNCSGEWWVLQPLTCS